MGGYDLLNFLTVLFYFSFVDQHALMRNSVFSFLCYHSVLYLYFRHNYNAFYNEFGGTHTLTLTSSLFLFFLVSYFVDMLFVVIFLLVLSLCQYFLFSSLKYLILWNIDWFLVGRRVLLHFEAVDSAFCAWINGHPVGYRYLPLPLSLVCRSLAHKHIYIIAG